LACRRTGLSRHAKGRSSFCHVKIPGIGSLDYRTEFEKRRLKFQSFGQAFSLISIKI